MLERVAGAASQLARAVASAGELLGDGDLRRRGAALVVDEAARSLQGLQRGLERGANSAVNAGVAQVEVRGGAAVCVCGGGG